MTPDKHEAEGSTIRPWSSGTDRALGGLLAVACAALLVYKFLLVRMLNINWDEFHFLSHVYSLTRGHLSHLMLGGYTHLFSWLPSVPGGEVDQIVVARFIMVVLLCVTAWLIWRLSRIWLEGAAALVPPFIYVAAMPVMVNGGSFRYDSMLAPLSVAVLILLFAPGRSVRREWFAGALSGAAVALTVKAMLFAPLYLIAVCMQERADSLPPGAAFRQALASLGRVAFAAGLTAALLLGLHSLSLTNIPADAVVGFAGSAARKTLLDTQWFPRIHFLDTYVRWQPLFWLLIFLGALLAVVRRRLALASLALSLLPLAFYRNAFPYYYVVMLAPASILAGYTVQEVAEFVRRHASASATLVVIGAIWLGLLYQGIAYAGRLWFDDQAQQRMLLSAVHEIFPEPVNYVDRCAMVSSFHKVNFFMSTWGMETYQSRGEPFMPVAIREHRPAFILVNTPYLDLKWRKGQYLLDDDYDLIERYFPEFWGPLRVAGGSTRVTEHGPARIEVPYPAEYRIRSTEDLLFDGVLMRNGDVVSMNRLTATVDVARPLAKGEELEVRLALASARNPPPQVLPAVPLFSGF